MARRNFNEGGSCDGGSLVYVVKELLDRINRIHRISAVNFKDFVHSVSIIRFLWRQPSRLQIPQQSTLNSQLLHACVHSALSSQLSTFELATLIQGFFSAEIISFPAEF